LDFFLNLKKSGNSSDFFSAYNAVSGFTNDDHFVWFTFDVTVADFRFVQPVAEAAILDFFIAWQ
jgi:hypothetical protein